MMPDFFEEEKVRHWLFNTAAQFGKSIKTINYIFCSDKYLLQINKEYLQHDYYTDIITFPYQEGDIIESDIFVSVDRIKDNASTIGTPFNQEFHRVIIHGLLHLCGIKDKTEEDAKKMRNAEEKALTVLSQ